MDMFSLEMFENIAYIMAKHADPNIPDTPEEWLDEFNTFSIYIPSAGAIYSNVSVIEHSAH